MINTIFKQVVQSTSIMISHVHGRCKDNRLKTKEICLGNSPISCLMHFNVTFASFEDCWGKVIINIATLNFKKKNLRKSE